MVDEDAQHEDPMDEPTDADAADDAGADDTGDGEHEEFGEDDGELTLDALSAAYAGIASSQPVADQETPADDEASADQDGTDDADESLDEHVPAVDELGEVTPRGILEAMLFVGDAENKPLTARQIAALMRGYSPREIDELVVELNETYEQRGCPFEIVSQGPGYVMRLKPQFEALRDRFLGRVRDAKLSQHAIDVLAIVAYRQPIQREEVEQIRGKPSGGVLSQLVRRQLLRVEQSEQKPRKPKYFTTDRFLRLMGLDTLGELPQGQDFDVKR